MHVLDFTALKPANYTRKSSEGEDRQALSIDSQVAEADRISISYVLPPYVVTFKEAKSAKIEFNRPQFSELLTLIRAGKVDSIVCWKLDRLARNMTEGGQIIDLLSAGTLKVIITHDRAYYPHDNVLLMALEFGQGHQYVKDLSVNVKRGLKDKARLGLPPGKATLGFLNDLSGAKGNRRWIVDEVRLPKIRTLFQMALTGRYSAAFLHQFAVTDLHLTTVPRGRQGGRPIARSRIYELLTDPVFAGFFFHAGERYDLDSTLPRLITEVEHFQIKTILSGAGFAKTEGHQTIFSGFITSPEGDFIGQDLKFQMICDCKTKFAYRHRTQCPSCGAEIATLTHPKYLKYVFYYNVRKKKAQKAYKVLGEKQVATFVYKHLIEPLMFSAELVAWSKEYFNELQIREVNDHLMQRAAAEERRAELERKKARLRAMLRDQHITEQEYRTDLAALHADDAASQAHTAPDWYTRMNEIADITLVLRQAFTDGPLEQQRHLLRKLGSNLIWDDETLSISNRFDVEVLIQGMKAARLKFPEFEPANCVVYKSPYVFSDLFLLHFSTMLGNWDEVRTSIISRALTASDAS